MESINREFLVIINENRDSLLNITFGLSLLILFMTIAKIFSSGFLSSPTPKLSKLLLASFITLVTIFAVTILYGCASDDKLDTIEFIITLCEQMAVAIVNCMITDILIKVPSGDSKSSSNKGLLKPKRIKI